MDKILKIIFGYFAVSFFIRKIVFGIFVDSFSNESGESIEIKDNSDGIISWRHYT